MDLLPGTLDLMVLGILEDGPLHGYGIARRIEERSDEAFQVEQGSLYPALYRLEKAGLVRWAWGRSETGRRVKRYRLAQAGRERLEQELAGWDRFVTAVGKVVRREG